MTMSNNQNSKILANSHWSKNYQNIYIYNLIVKVNLMCQENIVIITDKMNKKQKKVNLMCMYCMYQDLPEI